MKLDAQVSDVLPDTATRPAAEIAHRALLARLKHGAVAAGPGDARSFAIRLGAVLREAREARGVTSAAFAHKARISEASVALLEAGSDPASPRWEDLLKYAHALELELTLTLQDPGAGEVLAQLSSGPSLERPRP